MLNLDQLVSHWRYAAIFIIVILGNVGVPVPEESILLLAGYLVWREELEFPLVFAVAVASACIGDNLGYDVGKHYGRLALEQYGKWIFVTPRRFESMQRFMMRHGPVSVFIARFLPGFRFIAGPLAGIVGMPYASFLFANLLGGILYIPCAVGVGYGIGLGFGEYIERLERVVGKVEHLVLFVTVAGALIVLAFRIIQARRDHFPPPKT